MLRITGRCRLKPVTKVLQLRVLEPAGADWEIGEDEPADLLPIQGIV